MTRRRKGQPVSRANRNNEHAYLLNRIPREVWAPAVARAAQEHAQVCEGAGWRGSTAAPERCPVHSMRAVLLDLLKHYGAGTLVEAATRR